MLSGAVETVNESINTRANEGDTELDGLRRESEHLADDLSSSASIEVNAALLDLAPGDPVATTRLSIGLLNSERAAEAVPVLRAGLLVHPSNKIMIERLRQAQYAITKRTSPSSADGRVSKGSSGAWDDLDIQDLLDRSLAGEGKDACLRFCATSLRARVRVSTVSAPPSRRSDPAIGSASSAGSSRGAGHGKTS